MCCALFCHNNSCWEWKQLGRVSNILGQILVHYYCWICTPFADSRLFFFQVLLHTSKYKARPLASSLTGKFWPFLTPWLLLPFLISVVTFWQLRLPLNMQECELGALYGHFECPALLRWQRRKKTPLFYVKYGGSNQPHPLLRQHKNSEKDPNFFQSRDSFKGQEMRSSLGTFSIIFF